MCCVAFLSWSYHRGGGGPPQRFIIMNNNQSISLAICDPRAINHSEVHCNHNFWFSRDRNVLCNTCNFLFSLLDKRKRFGYICSRSFVVNLTGLKLEVFDRCIQRFAHAVGTGSIDHCPMHRDASGILNDGGNHAEGASYPGGRSRCAYDRCLYECDSLGRQAGRELGAVDLACFNWYATIEKNRAWAKLTGLGGNAFMFMFSRFLKVTQDGDEYFLSARQDTDVEPIDASTAKFLKEGRFDEDQEYLDWFEERKELAELIAATRNIQLGRVTKKHWCRMPSGLPCFHDDDGVPYQFEISEQEGRFHFKLTATASILFMNLLSVRGYGWSPNEKVSVLYSIGGMVGVEAFCNERFYIMHHDFYDGSFIKQYQDPSSTEALEDMGVYSVERAEGKWGQRTIERRMALVSLAEAESRANRIARGRFQQWDAAGVSYNQSSAEMDRPAARWKPRNAADYAVPEMFRGKPMEERRWRFARENALRAKRARDDDYEANIARMAQESKLSPEEYFTLKGDEKSQSWYGKCPSIQTASEEEEKLLYQSKHQEWIQEQVAERQREKEQAMAQLKKKTQGPPTMTREEKEALELTKDWLLGSPPRECKLNKDRKFVYTKGPIDRSKVAGWKKDLERFNKIIPKERERPVREVISEDIEFEKMTEDVVFKADMDAVKKLQAYPKEKRHRWDRYIRKYCIERKLRVAKLDGHLRAIREERLDKAYGERVPDTEYRRHPVTGELYKVTPNCDRTKAVAEMGLGYQDEPSKLTKDVITIGYIPPWERLESLGDDSARRIALHGQRTWAEYEKRGNCYWGVEDWAKMNLWDREEYLRLDPWEHELCLHEGAEEFLYGLQIHGMTCDLDHTLNVLKKEYWKGRASSFDYPIYKHLRDRIDYYRILQGSSEMEKEEEELEEEEDSGEELEVDDDAEEEPQSGDSISQDGSYEEYDSDGREIRKVLIQEKWRDVMRENHNEATEHSLDLTTFEPRDKKEELYVAIDTSNDVHIPADPEIRAWAMKRDVGHDPSKKGLLSRVGTALSASVFLVKSLHAVWDWPLEKFGAGVTKLADFLESNEKFVDKDIWSCKMCANLVKMQARDQREFQEFMSKLISGFREVVDQLQRDREDIMEQDRKLEDLSQKNDAFVADVTQAMKKAAKNIMRLSDQVTKLHDECADTITKEEVLDLIDTKIEAEDVTIESLRKVLQSTEGKMDKLLNKFALLEQRVEKLEQGIKPAKKPVPDKEKEVVPQFEMPEVPGELLGTPPFPEKKKSSVAPRSINKSRREIGLRKKVKLGGAYRRVTDNHWKEMKKLLRAVVVPPWRRKPRSRRELNTYGQGWSTSEGEGTEEDPEIVERVEEASRQVRFPTNNPAGYLLGQPRYIGARDSRYGPDDELSRTAVSMKFISSSDPEWCDAKASIEREMFRDCQAEMDSEDRVVVKNDPKIEPALLTTEVLQEESAPTVRVQARSEDAVHNAIFATHMIEQFEWKVSQVRGTILKDFSLPEVLWKKNFRLANFAMYFQYYQCKGIEFQVGIVSYPMQGGTLMLAWDPLSCATMQKITSLEQLSGLENQLVHAGANNTLIFRLENTSMQNQICLSGSENSLSNIGTLKVVVANQLFVPAETTQHIQITVWMKFIDPVFTFQTIQKELVYKQGPTSGSRETMVVSKVEAIVHKGTWMPESSRNLVSLLVHPCAGILENEMLTQTPLGVMSSLYARWSGSLIYKFVFGGSKYAKGRLAMVVVPVQFKITSPTLEQLSGMPLAIYDLSSNDREIELVAPFFSIGDDLEVKQDFLYDKSAYDGTQITSRLHIFVIDPLILFANASNNIQFFVSMRPGNDFKLKYPTGVCAGKVNRVLPEMIGMQKAAFDSRLVGSGFSELCKIPSVRKMFKLKADGDKDNGLKFYVSPSLRDLQPHNDLLTWMAQMFVQWTGSLIFTFRASKHKTNIKKQIKIWYEPNGQTDAGAEFEYKKDIEPPAGMEVHYWDVCTGDYEFVVPYTARTKKLLVPKSLYTMKEADYQRMYNGCILMELQGEEGVTVEMSIRAGDDFCFMDRCPIPKCGRVAKNFTYLPYHGKLFGISEVPTLDAPRLITLPGLTPGTVSVVADAFEGLQLPDVEQPQTPKKDGEGTSKRRAKDPESYPKTSSTQDHKVGIPYYDEKTNKLWFKTREGKWVQYSDSSAEMDKYCRPAGDGDPPGFYNCEDVASTPVSIKVGMGLAVIFLLYRVWKIYLLERNKPRVVIRPIFMGSSSKQHDQGCCEHVMADNVGVDSKDDAPSGSSIKEAAKASAAEVPAPDESFSRDTKWMRRCMETPGLMHVPGAPRKQGESRGARQRANRQMRKIVAQMENKELPEDIDELQEGSFAKWAVRYKEKLKEEQEEKVDDIPLPVSYGPREIFLVPDRERIYGPGIIGSILRKDKAARSLDKRRMRKQMGWGSDTESESSDSDCF